MTGRAGRGRKPLRVERAHRVRELAARQGRIHRRGLDVAVSEVLLHGSEVLRSPQQLDRARVSERVRMESLHT